MFCTRCGSQREPTLLFLPPLRCSSSSPESLIHLNCLLSPASSSSAWRKLILRSPASAPPFALRSWLLRHPHPHHHSSHLPLRARRSAHLHQAWIIIPRRALRLAHQSHLAPSDDERRHTYGSDAALRSTSLRPGTHFVAARKTYPKMPPRSGINCSGSFALIQFPCHPNPK